MALVSTKQTGRNFTEEGRAEAKKLFLEGYAATGTIRGGCNAAQVNRDTYRYWFTHDKEFAARLEHAKEEYNDILREEIHRRGVDGVPRTRRIYFKGMLVDEWEDIEYSDAMLKMQAQARMPEYREKRNEEGLAQIPVEAIWDLLNDIPDAARVPPTPSTPVEPFPSSVVEGEFSVVDEVEVPLADSE